MNLSDLLDRQHHQLEQLLTLLRREQDILVQGKVDGPHLERIAEAKQTPLRALESLEKNRAEAQAALGYREDPAATEQAVAACGCLALWQDIQDMGRQAAYLNQLNGTLIQHRLTHNQRVLGDLRRMAGNHLYGADGQHRRTTAGLRLQA